MRNATCARTETSDVSGPSVWIFILCRRARFVQKDRDPIQDFSVKTEQARLIKSLYGIYRHLYLKQTRHG